MSHLKWCAIQYTYCLLSIVLSFTWKHLADRENLSSFVGHSSNTELKLRISKNKFSHHFIRLKIKKRKSSAVAVRSIFSSTNKTIINHSHAGTGNIEHTRYVLWNSTEVEEFSVHLIIIEHRHPWIYAIPEDCPTGCRALFEYKWRPHMNIGMYNAALGEYCHNPNKLKKAQIYKINLVMCKRHSLSLGVSARDTFNVGRISSARRSQYYRTRRAAPRRAAPSDNTLSNRRQTTTDDTCCWELFCNNTDCVGAYTFLRTKW